MKVIFSIGFALLLLAGMAVSWANNNSVQQAPNAELLYDRFCLACHGSTGDGQGPGAALLWPRPRDFQSGNYKWRSTPSGLPPTDKDLRRAIRYGAPGTSMHGFSDTLSTSDIDAIIAKLKAWAPRKFSREATLIALPPQEQQIPDIVKGKKLFGTLGCVKCHGTGAHGDGPSSKELKDDHNRPAAPYDLTTHPLRRPSAPADKPIEQIYMSLVTGLSGSPMPSYDGAAPPADLWAVASYIESIRSTAPKQAWNNPSEIAKPAQVLDQTHSLMRAGYYPGHGTPDESNLFGGPIMPQGPAPKSLAPAQASLDTKQCARCHSQQFKQWKSSLHAGAGSPGLIAQLESMERKKQWPAMQSCQRCHNPLAEQSPILSAEQMPARQGSSAAAYQKNSSYSKQLRAQGLSCASCHVRKWQRYGPPKLKDGKRLHLPGYPVTELAIYERSDFCLPCHQLPVKNVLHGKPLLNTYKEWLEGPYMRRGIQCQHCHMPDREHSWKGIHDPDTFRQGIAVQSIAGRTQDGSVSVRVKVENIGAGHYLPTTPTPAAWVSVQLLDKEGDAIDGAFAEKRIGRHLVYDKGWQEREDTRIAPGESLELTGAWKDGRVEDAAFAQIKIRVEPDEYYERFYMRRLKNTKLPASERLMFEEALKRTRTSHYTAYSYNRPVIQY